MSGFYDKAEVRTGAQMPASVQAEVTKAQDDFRAWLGRWPRFLVMSQPKYDALKVELAQYSIYSVDCSVPHDGQERYQGMILGRTNQPGLYVCSKIDPVADEEIRFKAYPTVDFFVDAEP